MEGVRAISSKKLLLVLNFIPNLLSLQHSWKQPNALLLQLRILRYHRSAEEIQGIMLTQYKFSCCIYSKETASSLLYSCWPMEEDCKSLLSFISKVSIDMSHYAVSKSGDKNHLKVKRFTDNSPSSVYFKQANYFINSSKIFLLRFNPFSLSNTLKFISNSETYNKAIQKVSEQKYILIFDF